jgi:poly(3-hydroxybutyrate) depolymerase
MLYEVREAQRAVLTPVSNWAGAMSKLYSSPYSPFSYTPLATRAAAGFELLHRLGKEYEKPAFGLATTTIDGIEVPVEERVTLDKPFCRLLHFERQLPSGLQARRADPRVLLVAPLSGHHATLLRDTVRAMLPDHDVYITDWIDARMVPQSQGDFHLHDYVEYCIDFLRHLGAETHVISVCQPTVPVLAALSVMATLKDPQLPRSMTLMGGPIDPRRSPTAVNDLATTKPYQWFERTVIHRVPGRYPGSGRRVYPGFLQHAGFVAMNPDRHAQSHWDFYLNLVRGDLEDAESHRRFYDEYNAVMDLPADYYLETIRTVFQEFLLPRGLWELPVNGRTMRVRPADIRNVPLLTIEGELDDISGVGQTAAAHDLCSGLPSSMHQHLHAEGAGHYGIFSGRRWREIIYPYVRGFIADAARPRRRKSS